jgi:hypothetical protein
VKREVHGTSATVDEAGVGQALVRCLAASPAATDAVVWVKDGDKKP